jgi:2,4-dienoyl-CoA reductase-like NADH-dependent reductase (Old Yellow Enzyme family)
MVFTPFTLRNGLTLKNRLVMAPMTTSSSYEDGNIRESELAYLQRRAVGGFGMIMTAACYVHPTGHAFDGQFGCESDGRLPSLNATAEAINSGGAASVLQIHHGGRMAPTRLSGTMLSASAIAAERPNAETPRAMTEDEIWGMIRAYADAARRAKDAGFDGVEIHGANTYLLQQFVSPHSNRRDDAWGADRLRFSREVTDAVLAAVGPSFAVGYRFSPEEVENPGITIAETESLVDMLADKPLDWLHVSLQKFEQTSLRGEYTEPTIERLSKVIGRRVPFMGVGAIKTLQDAERCLELGCELVALGRAAVTAPEWPQETMTGATPRRAVPARDAANLLTIPDQLAEKIYSIQGWFEVDEEAPEVVTSP